MTRRERYARSQFAPWPDAGLRAAAAELTWPFFILRTDLRHHRPQTLIVDVSYEGFQPSGDPSIPPDVWPQYHSRALRLTWTGRIFALESYDEFYASGPMLAAHESRDSARPGPFMEIVSDPDPWIEQILEQNGNTDTFPPYGQPVLMSGRTRAEHPHLRETGRFFAPDARLEDGGRTPVFFWTGPSEPTQQERNEFEAQVDILKEQERQQMLARPRYRHLLIATESHFLEILSEDLPRWEWVTVKVEED